MTHFGREITSHFSSAARREWLVTNGLGGWASGTVAGANTRRYHGLFVPALQPPLGRTVLLSKLNERAVVAGQTFALSSNEYGDGTLDPHGYRHIEDFRLDWGVPTWTFALADALLEKRLWMPHGRDTVYVSYTLRRASTPLELDVVAMVTHRDAHVETHGGNWQPQFTPVQGGALINPPDHGWRLLASSGELEPVNAWHYNLLHRVETQRGLPDREDQFALGRFSATLRPADTWVLAATLESDFDWDWANSLAAEQTRARGLVATAGLTSQPPWIQQHALAADQFLVRRGPGTTVIAGYHWFSDWGRDTMIALPGLTLATRRFDLAADIMETCSHFISDGMLPNRFPDAGEQPEYNTVDATLWYFHALDRYVAASGDLALARRLLPALADIIAWHVR
ncbi:MAG: glycogen debranching enzyme N-terminal domain-containing protein, partial [Anaerolineales bacterium]